jgi:MFS family permease
LIAFVLHAVGHHQPALATAGYLILFVLIGAIDASFLIGFLAYVLDIAPPGERTAYTGLANTIGGLVVIAPTIGGIILQLTSYPVLFVCAAMGGVLSFLATLRLPTVQVDVG